MNTVLYNTKNEELAAILVAALNERFEDKEVFEAVEVGDGTYNLLIKNRILGPIGADHFKDCIEAMKCVYLVMKGVIELKKVEGG